MLNLLNNKIDKKNEEVEFNTFIINKFNQLTETEREVIILRVVKGYSIGDVSILLEKPECTVKSLQFNAIRKLSSELHAQK